MQMLWVFYFVFPFFVVGEDASILYTDVQPANCTDSLRRLRDVNINTYKFRFDSIAGRTQMGILGRDAEAYFPESVEVIPTYNFPSKEKGKPGTTVHNFPVVDKNVLFMHGLAALKALIQVEDGLRETISYLEHSGNDHKHVFEEIERRLSQEADDQLIEEKRLLEEQRLLAEREAALSRMQELQQEEQLKLQMEQQREILHYQEQMHLDRLKYEEALAEKRINESLSFELDLVEKKELLRRETEERLISQRLEFDRNLEEQRAKHQEDYIRAEIRAKAEQERENEDLTIRQLQLQAELDTQRVVSSINVVLDQCSTLARNLISQPKQLAMLLGIVLLFMTCLNLIRALATTMREVIQTSFGRPSLVRETSRHLSILPEFTTETMEKGMAVIRKYFEDVILAPETMERVTQLALATRNTKNSKAPYRHVLLHGPPGTGKTLIARHIALCSGMDYAIMSGGDVGPLGEDAVSQLHKLFQWANRSKKGLLLFIDESEAFLGSREKFSGADNTHIRHALNALLYQTGTPSNTFMLMLATNRPEELDPAVLDRLDVSLFIGLPAQEQRFGLAKFYLNKHVRHVVEEKTWWGRRHGVRAEENCFDEKIIKEIAQRTEGFSGREISKFMISVQYAMFLAPEKTLTSKLLLSVLKTKLDEHNQKEKFGDIKTPERHDSPSNRKRSPVSSKLLLKT